MAHLRFDVRGADAVRCVAAALLLGVLAGGCAGDAGRSSRGGSSPDAGPDTGWGSDGGVDVHADDLGSPDVASPPDGVGDAADGGTPDGGAPDDTGGGEDSFSPDAESGPTIGSTGGCWLDPDCAAGLFCHQQACVSECWTSSDCASGSTCDPRGRCVAADVVPVPPLSETTPGGRGLSFVPPVHWIAPGQHTLTLQIPLDGVPSEGDPGVRIERTDEPERIAGGEGREVGRVVGDMLELSLETGRARPDGPDPGRVDVRVITSFGVLSLALLPAQPVDGTWDAVWEVDAPFVSRHRSELRLWVEPAGASLGSAERVWVGLENTGVGVFRPAGGSTRAWVVRPMTKEPRAGWVAGFREVWRGDAGSLVDREGGRVIRSLRVEVRDAESGRLSGTFVDRWTGLYAREQGGVAEPETVVASGRLVAVRAGDLPSGARPAEDPQTTEEARVLDEVRLVSCEASQFSEVSACAGISPSRLESAPSSQRVACLEALGASHVPDASRCVSWFFGEVGSGAPPTSLCGATFDEFLTRCRETSLCAPERGSACVVEAATATLRVERDTALRTRLLDLVHRAGAAHRVGEQVRAFDAETRLRRRWLLSEAARGDADWARVDTEAPEVLTSWRDEVSAAHSRLTASLLQASSLRALSLPVRPGSPEEASRRALLTQAWVSWSALLDARTWESRQSHRSLSDRVARLEARDALGPAELDLYLTGAMLGRLSLDLQSDEVSALLAQADIGALREWVDGLSGAREAVDWTPQVVVTRALDGATDVLAQRGRLARDRLARALAAASEVGRTPTWVTDERQLRDRQFEEVEALRLQQALICGVDASGCASGRPEDPACAPLLEPGECGFVVAGTRDALGRIDVVGIDAGDVGASRAGRLLLDLIVSARAVVLHELELSAHEERLSLAIAELEALTRDAERFRSIRVAGVEKTFAAVAEAQKLRWRSRRLQTESGPLGQVDHWLGVAGQIGGAFARGGEKPGGEKFLGTLMTGAAVAKAITGHLASAERARRARKALSLEEKAAQVEAARQREAQLEQAMLVAESEQARVRAQQAQVMQLASHGEALEQRILLSELEVLRGELAYRAAVDEARGLAARRGRAQATFDALDAVRQSPSVVMARARGLADAEDTLEEARAAMREWLAAIEYAAVRPLVAERHRLEQVRTARDLDVLARHLETLEQRCGGAISRHAVEVSLRWDLLGLHGGVTDAVTGLPVTGAERFRRVLSESWLPATEFVRMAPAGLQSGPLGRTSGLLAVPFTLMTGAFSNLAISCNARVSGIGVMLVGDVGRGQPAVTLAYGDRGTLRSCQPDSAFTGAGSGEAIARTTHYRAIGSAAGLPATIQTWAPTLDASFQGYPLAASWVVAIDTTLPANAGLDWSRLEDVVLRIEFTYQNPFTSDCSR